MNEPRSKTFANYPHSFTLLQLGILYNKTQQQQQQCIYLKKYKVYNTLCPANSYNANLDRTGL